MIEITAIQISIKAGRKKIMTQVTYVSANGDARSVEVEAGKSLMQGAIDHGVGGIYAECGGQLQCATCHVMVREKYLPLLSEMTEDEDEMLEATACERTDSSRLGCQVHCTETLKEIIVDLPESQR